MGSCLQLETIALDTVAHRLVDNHQLVPLLQCRCQLHYIEPSVTDWLLQALGSTNGGAIEEKSAWLGCSKVLFHKRRETINKRNI